ncbi:PREDICTED: G-type lectin S-receptor-like serine/threonine-protein kinase CES101 [Prunus mume]|uniref:Receptor-like serine/threonine-protein kinase n=1 Tax=Prunus mume TaxID=102107 RepID=A0ABM0NKH0_PRUMU|nr:PREDICTED: G-type lectin S-receptor-like serine/threonine-protein kinase CES101 [Prunus mume]
MASCSLNIVWSLVSFSCTIWSACYAANRDTLKPGDTLNSSDTLVSATGKFTLNFTVLDEGKPNSSYLVLQRTEDIIPFYSWIWIANRNTPIMYPTGALTLDRNGTLKITQKGRDPIELFSAPRTTNINSTTSVVVATLLDTGNFVLKELSSIDGSTKQVLWQSFDYLADTFLPGMKLGVNYRNDHIWLLTSSLIYSSPETGAFTFEWDPKGHQLQIKQRGVLYWSSGAFRDGTFEFLSPYYGESNKRSVYNFIIVSNGNEDYFTYTTTVHQSNLWSLDSEGYLLKTLPVDGHLPLQSPSCDGFNTDGGCQKRHQPTCRHLGDRFETKVGYFDSSTIESSEPTIDWNTSLGISDCKAACWENCDCHGFDFPYDNKTGCRFWTGNWEFNENTTGDTTTNYFVLPKSSRRNAHKWIWTGTAIAVALLVMVLCISSYLLRRKLFSGETNPIIENELLEWMETDRSTGDVNGNDGKIGNNLTVFRYASVVAATTNFSEENKLGQGGFGPVYKGKLVTGQEIAVKRLSRCSGQGTLEFKNELILISELQHTNLVQLFGFCIHGEERILIYAYMPNKSLDYFLFDSTRAMLLDWTKRFNIIEGIAQGLLYLHKYSRMRVIHRDLKASNILLDENMKPKISDFGLARIFTHNELEANTNKVVGTYGYMSPEYAMEGIFSIKSDVYSFGVLMLEIISGRRNSSFYNADRVLNIVGYAWELWKEGRGLELMDPTLKDSCTEDQLLRCFHVGLLCVEENAADRPSMSDVISMLTTETISLPLPTRPAFITRRNVIVADISRRELQIISVNGLSNTTVAGR